MRILQTTILLFLIACQSDISDKDMKPQAQSQSNTAQEFSKESKQQSQKITNGIVFKDAPVSYTHLTLPTILRV